MSEPFRLLYVCTGNICRSPFAQLHTRFLLEARLGPRASRIVVASAGVGAVVGAGMHPASREQLTSRRDHPATEAFRARQLPESEVARADLVLTMTRRHRARVLEDTPSALRRVFTLKEFARLLDDADPAGLPFLSDPAERARDLVPAVLAARGTVAPVDASVDAVPDPIDGDLDAHAAATREIDVAVRRILDLVAPFRPAPAPRPPVRRSPSEASGHALEPMPHPSGPLVALEPAVVGGA